MLIIGYGVTLVERFLAHLCSGELMAVFTLQANWRSDAKRGEAKQQGRDKQTQANCVCLSILYRNKMAYLRSRENSI